MDHSYGDVLDKNISYMGAGWSRGVTERETDTDGSFFGPVVRLTDGLSILYVFLPTQKPTMSTGL